MKNPKQLLCNQYNENLTNVSRTDKIGASNHLEMIDDIIDGLNIHTVTGTGLDKDAADANKESIEGDSDTLKKGTGHEWNHVSITNPLKD